MLLSRRPRNPRPSIPRTNLHAKCAAGAGVVVDFNVGGEWKFTETDEASVVRRDRDAGFATGALVVVDKRHAR